MTSDSLRDAADAGALSSDMPTWRQVLHARLAGNATPVVQFPDTVQSAASLWAGARAWTHALRAGGMVPGHVIVSALPAGPALLQLLVACLWDGYGLLLQPPDAADDALAANADAHEARLLIHWRSTDGEEARWWHRPHAGGWPEEGKPLVPRGLPATQDRVPVLADGVAAPRPHAALLEAVRTHALAQTFDGGRVLTAVGWDDAGALAHGVLLPLLVSEELFVLPPTDVDAAATVRRAEPITHIVTDDESFADAFGTGGTPLVRVPRTRPCR